MNYSKVKAVSIIVASMFITTLVGCIAVRGITRYRSCKSSKVITRIIQTGGEKEALATVYLTEMLGLSVDEPTSFDQFDPKWGERVLEKSPVIKSAHIKKVQGDALYIDYESYHPVALVGEFTNLAFDREGVIFPITPFFSPKRLPEFYLGAKSFPLDLERFQLALKIFDRISELAKVERVDLSSAFHPSFGKREIVVVMADLNRKIYLRLSPSHFEQALVDYLALHPEMSGGDKIIDLRIPRTAYVQEVERGDKEG